MYVCVYIYMRSHTVFVNGPSRLFEMLSCPSPSSLSTLASVCSYIEAIALFVAAGERKRQIIVCVYM